MKNFISYDTEYYNSNESPMKVVCGVAIEDEWQSPHYFDYYHPQDIIRQKEFLSTRSDGSYTIRSYAISAEVRSLLSLGINPLQFKWVDLYAEFRMLCNSNNLYNYGNYIDSDGNIAFSYPPKPSEESEEDNSSTPKNLVNALYKLCNIRVDTKQKDEMRNLILSKDDTAIKANMKEILEYCYSDTKHLEHLHIAINRAYQKLGLSGFEEDQLERGRYAVCMAIVEHNGIPINTVLLDKIVKNTPTILKLKKEEVNQELPGYFIPETQKPPRVFKNGKIFEYKKTEEKTNTLLLQSFIKAQNIETWPLTDSGKFKTDRKTLQDYGFISQIRSILRYNNLDNNLKWFRPKKTKSEDTSTFFDYVGSDNNVRPYYGIFGTQTGRNAAKAKSFPLAMGTWLRCIIQPPKGKVIIGCDFSQQEVYVAAKLSEDKNLMEAYDSGDVYLYFGKFTGVIPKDGTKDSHKNERNQFKATTLGKQFGMGIDKLHMSLVTTSGNKHLPRSEAEKMDRYHKETFSKFWQYTYDCSRKYQNRVPLITSDGFVLWQDNPILTSVRNFMIQGTAAAITRKAVVLLVEAGIHVIASLHDAIYVLTEESNHDIIILMVEAAMKKATEIILKEEKTSIRIDTKVITHDKVWVDEKGSADWERLKPILGV
jgi:DNA polymerase family A